MNVADVLDSLLNQHVAACFHVRMKVSLTDNLTRLASELRMLDNQFQAEPAPELSTLYAFRQALDGVRLTAWSVTELVHARSVAKTSDTVFSFLVTQRLRRFEQMVNNLCSDLDRETVPLPDDVLRPVANALRALQQRLDRRNVLTPRKPPASKP